MLASSETLKALKTTKVDGDIILSLVKKQPSAAQSRVKNTHTEVGV